MIPRSCLTKLGDHRNNQVAEKQKNDALFMVAWRELIEIIDFIENISQNVNIYTQPPSRHHQLMQSKSALLVSKPEKTILRASEKCELGKTDANRPVTPCNVVLRRLTNEQLESAISTTTRNKETGGTKKCSLPKTAISTMASGPPKAIKATYVDKKAKCEPPIPMVTRNQTKLEKANHVDSEQRKLRKTDANPPVTPCNIVLRRLTNEQLESTRPTTAENRVTGDTENNLLPKTVISKLGSEPPKAKKATHVDKKAKCEPPIPMITRNRRKEIEKRKQNKENE